MIGYYHPINHYHPEILLQSEKYFSVHSADNKIIADMHNKKGLLLPTEVVMKFRVYTFHQSIERRRKRRRVIGCLEIQVMNHMVILWTTRLSFATQGAWPGGPYTPGHRQDDAWSCSSWDELILWKVDVERAFRVMKVHELFDVQKLAFQSIQDGSLIHIAECLDGQAHHLLLPYFRDYYKDALTIWCWLSPGKFMSLTGRGWCDLYGDSKSSLQFCQDEHIRSSLLASFSLISLNMSNTRNYYPCTKEGKRCLRPSLQVSFRWTIRIRSSNKSRGGTRIRTTEADRSVRKTTQNQYKRHFVIGNFDLLSRW
jgi:hypothetical protein